MNALAQPTFIPRELVGGPLFRSRLAVHGSRMVAVPADDGSRASAAGDAESRSSALNIPKEGAGELAKPPRRYTHTCARLTRAWEGMASTPL